MILFACIPCLVRCMAVLSLLLFMGIVFIVGCFVGLWFCLVGIWYGCLFCFVVGFVWGGCVYRGIGWKGERSRLESKRMWQEMAF